MITTIKWLGTFILTIMLIAILPLIINSLKDALKTAKNLQNLKERRIV